MSFRLRRPRKQDSKRSPTPTDASLDGVRIGRYRVLTQIGVGSTGTVYAAHDPGLDRQIALKLVKREVFEQLDNARERGARGKRSRKRESGTPDRIMREARVMARLSHPNIVPIYDVGTTHDSVYIAMELIDGCTLRDWLAQTTRSWREVLAVYLQAGRGLAAAHDAGIVHRDFKPQNVLIGRDNRVRVLDFGLSRVGARSEPAPSDGAAPDQRLLGTPAYMAPEQHQGQPGDVRADQFSFCVALYEALYHQKPFSGTTVFAIADQVLDGNVRDPPLGTRVPSWLFTHIRRGLEVDPADRHPSLRSLLASIVFTSRILLG